MAVANDQLRKAPLFAELSDESLERIAQIVTEFDAPAGTVLIQPGEEGSGLFLVCGGCVTVDTQGAGSVELGVGESIGELALLTPTSRSARVSAKTPVHCLAVSRRDFDELLKTEPQIAISLLGVLARRLIEATGQ